MPLETKNLNAAECEVLSKVADWARQTIAFAISVRNKATPCSLDDAEVARLTGVEADLVTDELWSEVVNECDLIPQAIIACAEKVFDWCYKQTKK